MPPVSHLLYIPTVLMLGVAIGFVLGGRAASDSQAARARAEAKKAARRHETETATPPPATPSDG